MGQRGENVHGFLGLVPLLLRRPGADGAHVVQPIGQLDDDDPDVLRHGQQHLAHILRLLLLLGGKGDFVQLGHPVHQGGHIGAELLLHIRQLHRGILHHIVEDGGHDGLAVHPQIHQDAGHQQGMTNIILPRRSLLPLMGLAGQLDGPIHRVQIVRLFAFHNAPFQLDDHLVDRQIRAHLLIHTGFLPFPERRDASERASSSIMYRSAGIASRGWRSSPPSPRPGGRRYAAGRPNLPGR